jgi:hypothetical protein
MPACRSWETAWSWVVVLNSSVQLIATVSTSSTMDFTADFGAFVVERAIAT